MPSTLITRNVPVSVLCKVATRHNGKMNNMRQCEVVVKMVNICTRMDNGDALKARKCRTTPEKRAFSAKRVVGKFYIRAHFKAKVCETRPRSSLEAVFSCRKGL